MRLLLTVFVALGLSVSAFAQDLLIQEQSPTVAVGFQPQSFSYKAAEIDLDLRLAPRNWLTIAPKLQFGNPTSIDYYYDPVDAIKNGYGLALTYRYFPLTSKTKRFTDGAGPFVSLSGDVLSTNYSYLGNRYVPYTDTHGNEAFTVESDYPYEELVSRLGLSVNVGYNWRIFDILYLEGYLGVGVRTSNYEYDRQKGFDLGSNEWDTGYSGYCVSGGFRIGVFLNRYKYVTK
jgi:hypothetical protein